jgi:hypothetical protein
MDTRLSEIQSAISALRAAFRLATAAVSADQKASGLVFSGHMLEDALASFESELVRYVNRKAKECEPL